MRFEEGHASKAPGEAIGGGEIDRRNADRVGFCNQLGDDRKTVDEVNLGLCIDIALLVDLPHEYVVGSGVRGRDDLVFCEVGEGYCLARQDRVIAPREHRRQERW